MDNQTAKTVAVFERPFRLSGFDETLPAGEYCVETELGPPSDHKDPEAWRASAVVQLHTRESHPGLKRNLSVSLVELDHARVKDKLSEKNLSHFFLEQMLADPMVRLVMRADGVSEAQLRQFYLRLRMTQDEINLNDLKTDKYKTQESTRDILDVHKAENEGMPCRPWTTFYPDGVGQLFQ